MSAPSRFASAVCEELWVGGVLAERRFSCGEAIATTDAIEARGTRDDALIAQCETLLAAMRLRVDRRFRMRFVAEASLDSAGVTIVVSDGERSVVSTPVHLDEDRALLLRAAASGARRPVDPYGLPLLWMNGSGAVLLHEAVGHPREHALPMPPMPPWLTVDVSLAARRASFRDVPITRMTAVAAMQHDAPFTLPEERIEIHLVDGGAWDPLTDLVTVRVSFAEFVTGDAGSTKSLEPFLIAAPRDAIVRSLSGARGAARRYPGVICSREGQELFVASSAPDLLTVLR